MHTVLSVLALCGSLVAGRVDYANVLERGTQVKESYDYVIAGGGTAGLTVADRLTASGKCSIIYRILVHPRIANCL